MGHDLIPAMNSFREFMRLSTMGCRFEDCTTRRSGWRLSRPDALGRSELQLSTPCRRFQRCQVPALSRVDISVIWLVMPYWDH